MTAPRVSANLPGRDVPPLYRGIAADVTRSRTAAVKLFCLECVGFVRKDVTNCTATKCPLHRWRPYQSGEDDALPPEISGLKGAETAHADAEGSGVIATGCEAF